MQLVRKLETDLHTKAKLLDEQRSVIAKNDLRKSLREKRVAEIDENKQFFEELRGLLSPSESFSILTHGELFSKLKDLLEAYRMLHEQVAASIIKETIEKLETLRRRHTESLNENQKESATLLTSVQSMRREIQLLSLRIAGKNRLIARLKARSKTSGKFIAGMVAELKSSELLGKTVPQKPNLAFTLLMRKTFNSSYPF